MTDVAEATSWEDLIKNFKYKPNFRIEYVYKIDFDEDYIVLRMRVPDVNDPERLATVTIERLVDRFELLGEKLALKLIRNFIIELEIHEIDEWIMYDGKKIYDPHKEN